MDVVVAVQVDSMIYRIYNNNIHIFNLDSIQRRYNGFFLQFFTFRDLIFLGKKNVNRRKIAIYHKKTGEKNEKNKKKTKTILRALHTFDFFSALFFIVKASNMHNTKHFLKINQK